MADAEKKLCFVLMPFKEELKAVYFNAIKPAIEQAGFKSLRVDELKGTFNINRKIIENIFNSYVIIADLTHWNPNVFYEMGVAHAIDNKTIMIIQDKENVPFDVSTYRCLKYQPTEAGYSELKTSIIESLESYVHWCQEPTNPVQEFKPLEAMVSNSEISLIRKKLFKTEQLLKESIPKRQYEQTLTEINDLKKEKSIQHEKSKTLERKISNLENELAQAQKRRQTTAPLPRAIKRYQIIIAVLALFLTILIVFSTRNYLNYRQLQKPIKILSLRSNPDSLSSEDVETMLKSKGFYNRQWNNNAKGVTNQFEKQVIKGDVIVIDRATNLTWQQGGSNDYMNYDTAKEWLANLNKEGFAGFNDWRLPTLEEAMSLMERKKLNGDLYIDSKFDPKQRYIWTSDPVSGGSGRVWVVGFDYGGCGRFGVDGFGSYVRAVRSGQSSPKWVI